MEERNPPITANAPNFGSILEAARSFKDGLLAVAPTQAASLPVDTQAYRRAIRERFCAELAAAVYSDGPTGKPCFELFTHPLGSVGKAVTLKAFAFVDDRVGYISFRGTITAMNWLSDFHVMPTGQPLRHRGFRDCWQRLKPQVESWLDRHKPGEIILTGHSLGGAIAQLAAMELAPDWRIHSVVCFGAPLVGWRKFAAAYDNAAILGRSDATLGDVTTTFVFKSDLVRTFVLPRLGYKRNGQEITIDEMGRPSNEFLPWYLDAISTAYTSIVGDDHDLPVGVQGTFSYAQSQVFGHAMQKATALMPDAGNSSKVSLVQRPSGPPLLSMRMIVDTVRPYATPVVSSVPYLQAAVVAVGAMIAAWMSAKFFGRDVSYHSAQHRYLGALTERVNRWVPLAFQERGDELLAAKNAAGALPYFDAALTATTAEAHSAGLSDSEVHQWTWKTRLSRAAAQTALGNYSAAIDDLTTLIDAYPKGRIEVAAGMDGRFVMNPQIAAIERRAVVYELAGKPAEAMADYAALIGIGTDLSFGSFKTLIDEARRTTGAAGTLKTVLGYRSVQVDAEFDRLKEQREQGFRDGMAKTWHWAHTQRGICAFTIHDFETAIAEASAAIAIDSGDAWVYQLRAAANARAGHRDASLKDFTRAIELEPSVAAFHYQRGLAAMTVGSTIKKPESGSDHGVIEAKMTQAELSQIEADFRKTLELNPSHKMARSLLDSVAKSQVWPD